MNFFGIDDLRNRCFFVDHWSLGNSLVTSGASVAAFGSTFAALGFLEPSFFFCLWTVILIVLVPIGANPPSALKAIAKCGEIPMITMFIGAPSISKSTFVCKLLAYGKAWTDEKFLCKTKMFSLQNFLWNVKVSATSSMKMTHKMLHEI